MISMVTLISVNFPLLVGDVPRFTSYGIYISRLIRFARESSYVTDFNAHIISFLLPLIQEGQLSVTGESMCTKYWLTA